MFYFTIFKVKVQHVQWESKSDLDYMLSISAMNLLLEIHLHFNRCKRNNNNKMVCQQQQQQ